MCGRKMGIYVRDCIVSPEDELEGFKVDWQKYRLRVKTIGFK